MTGKLLKYVALCKARADERMGLHYPKKSSQMVAMSRDTLAVLTFLHSQAMGDPQLFMQRPTICGLSVKIDDDLPLGDVRVYLDMEYFV